MAKRLPLVLMCAGLALGAAGCGRGNATQSGLEKDLISDGLTTKQAQCISSKVFSTFSQNTANDIKSAQQSSDLTPAVRDKLAEITAGCGVKGG
jgi:hypothetical protein